MKKSLSKSSKWKQILLGIYRQSPHGFIETHNSNFLNDNHILAKEHHLTGMDLGNCIGFLREHELIKDTNPFEPLNHPQINPAWFNQILLTEKGFNVALELDKQFRGIREKRRFENLQKWLIGLTSILALSSIGNIFL